MRLFLAINLPTELRRRIVDATSPLREIMPGASWTAESKLHLTLKFLGEQGESRIDEITAATRAVASKHASTDVNVEGMGAFPAARRPRILWIGVERSPRLELLFHDLEVACSEVGFETEGRAFRPHITIGRIRERPTAEVARALARAGKKVEFQGSLAVESIDLMHSVPGGRAYDLVSSAPLARRER